MILPFCEVCGKPVDYVTETRNETLCLTTWTVRCHGQQKSFCLSDNTKDHLLVNPKGLLEDYLTFREGE